MIVGIGLDLVEVARICKAMRNPRFVHRILTDRERALSLTPERVAGRWAAKEAVAKAFAGKLGWHDVEVLAGPSGEPRVELQTGFAEGMRIHLSITHERGMAAAVAVVESVQDGTQNRLDSSNESD